MTLRTIALLPLVLLIGACSYTPLYPAVPVEQRQPDVDRDETPVVDESSPSNEQNSELPQERTRVAIATPATVNNNSASDRRRNERSATDELRAQARQASKKGELDRAERLLNRALRIAPREPLSYYELAELKLMQQQPGSALQMARKGLSLQPVGRLARKLRDAEQRASDSIL